MPETGCSILQFLGKFRAAFTQRNFPLAVQLFVGIILAGGSHTLAASIRVLRCLGVEGHFSRFYQFFSAHRWFAEVPTRLLIRCALELLDGQPVVIVLDDTLVEHRGPQIWGIGMHYDATRSTYGRGSRPRTGRFACGHNWVIASVVVPTPWGQAHFRALPVAAKLYRNAKHASDEYRKRTELAVELVQLVCRYIPSHVPVTLLGDSTYTCRTVARAVVPRVRSDAPRSQTTAWRRRHPKRLVSPRAPRGQASASALRAPSAPATRAPRGRANVPLPPLHLLGHPPVVLPLGSLCRRRGDAPGRRSVVSPQAAPFLRRHAVRRTRGGARLFSPRPHRARVPRRIPPPRPRHRCTRVTLHAKLQ